MTMNLFSSFNPTNYLFTLFFMINMFMFNIPIFSLGKNKFLLIKNIINFNLKNEFNKINKFSYSIKILIMIFMIIAFINLSNMLPFTLCLNSQFNMFFFMSLIMWMSCILYSMLFFFSNTLIHLTPMGCPMSISMLMVIIEFISLMIRPITLSVRMSANLLAGHLILHLMTEFSFFMMKLNYSILFTTTIILILNVLEIGVSLIQPYIFCTLINMYLCENLN